MSENITYRRAHVDEAAAIGAFISRVREQTYDLSPDTMAYAHMVEEIKGDPAIRRTIAASPDAGFSRVAIAQSGDLAGVILARRPETSRFDIIDNLHVDPLYQRHGIGRNLLIRHQRWAVRDQLAWVLATNREGLEFWRSQHFKESGHNFEESIGLDFIRMERQKRKRKAA